MGNFRTGQNPAIGELNGTPDSFRVACGTSSLCIQLGIQLAQSARTPPTKKLKIMMKSAWGSDDPTRASFAFVHGLALAEAGHDVQIFLTGEATYLMRKATADAIKPVGWPPQRYPRKSCR